MLIVALSTALNCQNLNTFLDYIFTRLCYVLQTYQLYRTMDLFVVQTQQEALRLNNLLDYSMKGKF